MASTWTRAARMSLNVPSALAVILGGIALVSVTASFGRLLLGLGVAWAVGYFFYEFQRHWLPTVGIGAQPDA